MRGAFNDVSIELAPGARRERVLADVDSILAPYGGRGAIGRVDQPSHRIVENEMKQLAVMGFAFPAFFVAIAAFLAGTILSRLIATERDQIAVLKAFGYTSRAVALHYLAYAALAVFLGIIVGGAVGAWVGRMYTGLYADVLRIPGLQFHADWGSDPLRSPFSPSPRWRALFAPFARSRSCLPPPRCRRRRPRATVRCFSIGWASSAHFRRRHA